MTTFEEQVDVNLLYFWSVLYVKEVLLEHIIMNQCIDKRDIFRGILILKTSFQNSSICCWLRNHYTF